MRRPGTARRRKRALLVAPWITDYAAYDYWLHPLGLLAIGGFLRARGWDLHLLDALAGARRRTRQRWDGTAPLRAEPLADPRPPASRYGAQRRFRRYGVPLAEFEARLRGLPRPDWILMSCQMTYWYPGLRTAREIIGRWAPEAPVILGGGYAALAGAHARRTPGLHALVTARTPAAALAQLCRHLGEPPPGPREARTWSLAWELCDELPHANVLTSWGCPLTCSYCATPRSWGRWQPRPPGVILRELTALAARPTVADVACVDDALLHRRAEHLLPLADAIERAGCGRERFRWHLPNALHPRWIDRPVAGALRRLGVETLWLGLESLDPRFHARHDGKLGRGDLERALAALAAERCRPRLLGAYLLAGLPGQSDASVLASLEAAHRHGLHVAVASYSPIPGSALFARAAAEDPRLCRDPLWQNNTLREMEAPARWRALRERARALNRRLAAEPQAARAPA
jgi:hypothetical protein